jgi:molecular chaperone HtpG
MAVSGDSLTEAVSETGRPVVLCKHNDIRALLGQCYPKSRVAVVRSEFVLVRAMRGEPTEADAALVTAAAEALARAGREVSRIALCRILGAHTKRAAVLIADDGQPGPWLCSAIEVERRASRWRATDALHLNVQSDTVALARKQAPVDPVAAGALLARALLVEARGPLDGDDSDRLLDLGRAGAVRPARGARS